MLARFFGARLAKLDDMDALHAAIASHRYETARILIDEMKEISLPEDVCNYYNSYALIGSEFFKELKRRKIDVSPLLFKAVCRNIHAKSGDGISNLLNAGYRADFKNSAGLRAVIELSNDGYNYSSLRAVICSKLLKSGANPNDVIEGMSHFEYALGLERYECALPMISNGLDLKKYGELAAHTAIVADADEAIFKYILDESGISPNGSDGKGRLLKLACSEGRTEIARLLLARGAFIIPPAP
jgi:hypothetical protein